MVAIIMATACFGFLEQPAADTQKNADFEKQQVRKWMEFYASEAKGYEIRRGGRNETERKLKLQPKSVINWSNPVTGNGTTHGACFVWTYKGRPEAFASIFSYIPSRQTARDKRTVAHAFHSLSFEPLVAKRNGEVFWSPQESGVELKPIPGASPPAKSRTARLVQLRNLARQFSATSTYRDSQSALRLLTQPLYRYESSLPDSLDGALFAFVTGTDPEILLLIEARRTDSGAKWHFAGARHSHTTLRLRYNDTEVWSDVRGSLRARPITERRYLSVHGIAIRDSVIK